MGERIFLKVDKNYAFIDGQNLIYNTSRKKDNPWKLDLARFRVYLEEKYGVKVAYYFIGSYDERHKGLYNSLSDYGYQVVFREHEKSLKSIKKGNVDTDIVFSVMEKIAEREKFDNVILISDDGDYWKMVNYLIKKGRFKKLLAPSQKNLSSLYRQKIADRYIDYLDKAEIRRKVEYKN